MSGYDDFGLGLQLGASGQIWVSASSRLGHVHGVTSVKPGGDVLVELSEHLYDVLDAIRFADPFDVAPITEALGRIAFGEPIVRELFQAARGAAADRGRQLIVRIQASPQLAALPWELLPDPSLSLGGRRLRHLTLSPDVHVVRLSRGRTYPIATEPVQPPLNLLVVLSSPMGQKPGDDALTFDIYEAKRNLLGELMSLQDGGWLNIDVEDRPTMDNLRRRIRSKRRGYHLLHYLGHAEPDLLLLEDDRGRRRDVNGTDLVDWLRSCPDLRLITFAGCETARPAGDLTAVPDSTDWQQLLSLAERAAQGSSPVVLGMQAVLPFRTEWLLTRSLYQALASGNTIVDALRLARGAVRSDDPQHPGLLDWAIPALFLNSTEPAPLLDRTGAPPRGERRRSNVAKLEPPTAGAALIGRDVPLRQAVEVLAGRTRERVLLITGPSGARASELLDRALDEIDGDVSDILSVSYRGLSDLVEANAFLSDRDGRTTLDGVVRANLCAAVSQLLERSDARSRDRRPGWTLPRWWAWLAEDLAGRTAVIAIDGLDALGRVSAPMRVLAKAWLVEAFPAAKGSSKRARGDLEDLIEHLSDPGDGKQSAVSVRHVEEFDAFLGGAGAGPDAVAREILADEAESMLNRRLQGADPVGGDGASQPGEIERARQELADACSAVSAVSDMLCKLIRRSPESRVALVVDQVPEGFLADVDDLVFPMRLGESTWPEMWRWLRRNLPALARFGQDRLKAVWRKYLGSDVERWEELERRVRARALPAVGQSGDGGVPGTEDAESDLEHLALQVCARPVRRRPGTKVAPTAGTRHRRDRPLVVAAAASLGEETESTQRLSFATFQGRLNALAEEHGIGGRVTTTTVNQVDTLAVLVPKPSPFKESVARDTDLLQWYNDVAGDQPDIVLLDFATVVESTADHVARMRAFPAHRTLQIAAGPNSDLEGKVYPAWDAEVLAVGAIDKDGKPRGLSDQGRRDAKPDIFATEVFDRDRETAGSAYASAYVVVAAILAWTLLPGRTPRALRRFLLDTAQPLDPETPEWPLVLDLNEVVAAARRERVVETLRRGRASLPAVVAMTGLNWQWAEATLELLVQSNRVAGVPVGRDWVYVLLDDALENDAPAYAGPAR